MKYLRYLFLVCYIFITLVIFTKALENSEKSQASSDQVTDIVVDTINGVTPGDNSITDNFDIEEIKVFIRKVIGHFGLFLVLGVFSTLTYFYFSNKKYISLIIILIVGILTAACSELLQLFADGRNPSFIDIIVDYLGYFIPVIIFYIPYYIKKKKVVSA